MYSIYLIVSCSLSVSQRLCKRCSLFFFFVLLLLNESPLLKITVALVCLFVCLSFLMLVYLCVCACVEGKTRVFHCCCSPPPFFLLLFKDSSFWIACGFCSLPSTLSVFAFFFCLFSRRKDSFSFLAIVCVCVCLLLLFATRRFEISQRLFFPPLSSLSLSPSLALPRFHFFFHFVFFFCFSVSLQSVAE